MPAPDHHENLERSVHQTLRALPPRRAPRTLEQRVLAELERRAALPWWRQSFAHWPLAARAVFLLLSAGLVKLTLMAVVWVMSDLDTAATREAVSTQFSWVQSTLAVWNSMTDFGAVVIHRIPPVWLYGTAAFVAAMYLTLFGLGAAAYRTLYASSSR
jgi:hypothetical protein